MHMHTSAYMAWTSLLCCTMFERKGHLERKVIGRKVAPSTCNEIDADVGYGHSPNYDGSSVLMSRPSKIPCARALTKTRAVHELIHPALHVQGAWCEGFAYHFALAHADMQKDSNNNLLFLLFPPTCLGHIGILFPFVSEPHCPQLGQCTRF